MLSIHRLFLSSASCLRNRNRFLTIQDIFFILVDHRTTFISSKTPGTSKDETNPVDEFLRANGR